MRRGLLVGFWVISGVFPLVGQDVDPHGTRRFGVDDGSGESLWKVQSPSGPSDWFNVDMDWSLKRAFIVTLHGDFGETGGIPGDHTDFAVFEESTTIANAPGQRVTGRVAPYVSPSDVAGSDSAYTIETKGVLPDGDYHLAVHFRDGDSHTWVAADTNRTIAGRSYFSATNYSTGAIPFSVNWMLAAGVFDDTSPGTLLINGMTSASVELTESGSGICLTFFGPSLCTPSLLYLCIGGTPFQQLLPASLTKTDGAFAGPCPMTWQICSTLTCNAPTGSGVEFCTLYFDLTDLKPNGKPTLKVGATATLTLAVDCTCLSGGGGLCFGQRDDCILDSTIWKIQNPALDEDWFNVVHGCTKGSATPVTELTGVSVSSWDFCGFGPQWCEVGIYPTNTAKGSCTPDIHNPIAVVRGSSASMAPAAGDWGCPLTFYDTPDVLANSTTRYHVAVHWPTGDTCIWLGSDTDGTDSPCGVAIPNNGCVSLFSSDAYASSAAPFVEANWMMQIEWR